jgi:hypothetical protein
MNDFIRGFSNNVNASSSPIKIFNLICQNHPIKHQTIGEQYFWPLSICRIMANQSEAVCSVLNMKNAPSRKSGFIISPVYRMGSISVH